MRRGYLSWGFLFDEEMGKAERERERVCVCDFGACLTCRGKECPPLLYH
jgi:hypothetical protein